MKKVSVIIPAFNNSDLTIKCLNSIISQSYQNIEIIVVDSCSSDNTLKILNKYKNKIKKLMSESDEGMYAPDDMGDFW